GPTSTVAPGPIGPGSSATTETAVISPFFITTTCVVCVLRSGSVLPARKPLRAEAGAAKPSAAHTVRHEIRRREGFIGPVTLDDNADASPGPTEGTKCRVFRKIRPDEIALSTVDYDGRDVP